jgi:uncharacterized OB-fold protein
MKSTTSSVATPDPIAEGLFTWPSDQPSLIGSRCRPCGTTTFPAQGSCPRCTAGDVEDRLLERTGTLWSFTVQGFRPKSPPYAGPAELRPYGVGYVELAGQVVVESILTVDDPAALEIGMPMELVVVPFPTGDAREVVTFAFRPVAEGAS